MQQRSTARKVLRVSFAQWVKILRSNRAQGLLNALLNDLGQLRILKLGHVEGDVRHRSVDEVDLVVGKQLVDLFIEIVEVVIVIELNVDVKHHASNGGGAERERKCQGQSQAQFCSEFQSPKATIAVS